MKNKRIGMAVLCGMLLLGGCGNARAVESVQENPDQAEEIQQDGGLADDGSDRENIDGSGTETSGASEDAGDDAVLIEVGPDKEIYEEAGSMTYMLHDFRLYESPEDAAIDSDELHTIDAEYYADQSMFLVMQADIRNIDYQGYDGVEEINLSTFTIAPKEQDDSLQWDGSLPVYLSESGVGDSYYHMALKQGESKTVTIGFYVPVKNIEELCSQCRISISGCMDEGYVFEIPTAQ